MTAGGDEIRRKGGESATEDQRSFAVQVQMVMPDAKSIAALPGAAFSDSYRVIVDEPDVDAITATGRVMGRAPGWIGALLALRNRIVAALGLKPARFGAFPVISHTPECVVLGFDDKHLDFRIVVDALEIGAGRSQITATTLVRTHNLLGRTYLAFVLPFHRMIVPAMLAQAARA